MKIIYLLITITLLTSCNFFSETKKVDINTTHQPTGFEIEETKKFNYINELLHYKNGYNLDTIKIVLKEYYKNYRHHTYDDKSNILVFKHQREEPYLTDLEFINKLEKKYSLKRKDLFLIVNDVDFYFKTEHLDEIETISEEVQDINSHFNKN